MLAFYSRRNWPEEAALILDIPSGPRSSNVPSTSDTSNQKLEEPLYNSKVPEYDLEHMPPTPSSAQEAKETISSSVSSSSAALDSTRVALIIETRPQPVLPAVLSQFVNNLPPAWVVRMVGTPEAFSIVMLSASLARHIKSGKLVLTELPESYLVHDSEALSTTLTNLTFYSEFVKPAEWLLMFQTDSMICAASEQTVDQWVDKGYTWVGAPWNLDTGGGNGGLSLRHVPSIIQVLKNGTRPANASIWEDRWLCDQLPNKAPPSIAQAFSVESVYYERPLGYHLRGSGKLKDLTIWGNSTRKRHILRYCPEVKIIMGNMNFESGTEKEDEKNENDAAASALNAVFMDVATKILDENGKQPPETKAPESTDVAATETTESAPEPTETGRWVDTKA